MERSTDLTASFSLNGILLSIKTIIPEGPEYENLSTLYQCIERFNMVVKSKLSEKRIGLILGVACFT